ncbi:hypothetical protein HDV05_004999 [Chytridiales sp. JEL 0842]|nr:hypothetical protein HDV05_004999 [Chytridiales sp. JEL 0842]
MAAPPPPSLPPGWLAQWSDQYKQYYYIELASGQSHWTLPALAPPPQGPPPSSAPVSPASSIVDPAAASMTMSPQPAIVNPAASVTMSPQPAIVNPAPAAGAYGAPSDPSTNGAGPSSSGGRQDAPPAYSDVSGPSTGNMYKGDTKMVPPPLSNPMPPQPVPVANPAEIAMQKFQQLVQRNEISQFMAVRLRKLEMFDIVLICDDSGSMNTPCVQGISTQNPYAPSVTRWQELKMTTKTILDISCTLDSDGVDVYFLNRQPLRNVTSPEMVEPVFAVAPQGYTPIARVLRQVIAEKGNRANRDAGKKLLILIATDGQPTDDRGYVDKQTLMNVLMNERGAPGSILVTFVACTDDESEIGYLNEWDKKISNVDVVDDYRSEKEEVMKVQGANFPFSRGDWVCKLLLGGIDPEIDALDERRVGGGVQQQATFGSIHSSSNVGKVYLGLHQPISVRLLRVRFTGAIHTKLYKSDSTFTNSSSSVTLFKEMISLVGTPDLTAPTTLVQAGEYEYGFSFRVPLASIPPSFEGDYGKVEYDVTAVLLRHGSMNRLATIYLTIPSTLSAEGDDIYRVPVEVKERLKVGRWFWKSGYLEVAASIPRSGYASEEVVPLKLEITNQSGSGLTLKEVCLKQKATYRAASETRGPNTEKVHKLPYFEHLPSTTRKITRTFHFPVPSAHQFSASFHSVLIDVSHCFCLTVQPDAKLSKPLRLLVPVNVTGFGVNVADVYFGREPSMDMLPEYVQEWKVEDALRVREDERLREAETVSGADVDEIVVLDQQNGEGYESDGVAVVAEPVSGDLDSSPSTVVDNPEPLSSTMEIRSDISVPVSPLLAATNLDASIEVPIEDATSPTVAPTCNKESTSTSIPSLTLDSAVALTTPSSSTTTAEIILSPRNSQSRRVSFNIQPESPQSEQRASTRPPSDSNTHPLLESGRISPRSGMLRPKDSAVTLSFGEEVDVKGDEEEENTLECPRCHSIKFGATKMTSPKELPECCRSGFLWEGTPTGALETIGNVEAYVARPSSAVEKEGKYVVIFTDVFGHVLPNVRLIADSFAKAGYTCVVPDIVQGDPINPTDVDGLMDQPQTYYARFSQILRLGWVAPTMATWLWNHTDATTLPVCDAVLKDLRQAHGATHIGAVGYCFGGRYSILKAGLDSVVDAFVAAHPSMVTMPTDVENLTKPGLFVLAETDAVFTAAMAERAKGIVKERGMEVEFEVYKGTVHGFAVRGQEQDPVVRKARNEALGRMIEFFGRTLGGGEVKVDEVAGAKL